MPKSQNEKTFDMPYLSILPEAVEAKVQVQFITSKFDYNNLW